MTGVILSLLASSVTLVHSLVFSKYYLITIKTQRFSTHTDFQVYQQHQQIKCRSGEILSL